MADITKVKLGACSVVFNSVDLGHTMEGVEVEYAPTFHEIAVDKYGGTAVQTVLIGEKFTAKVKLAESAIAKLEAAIPFGGTSSTKVTIGSAAGKLGTDKAALLVLHPLENDSLDRSLNVTMWKAISTSPIKLPFKNEGATVYEVTFMALLDESRTDGQYLGLIGDSAT